MKLLALIVRRGDQLPAMHNCGADGGLSLAGRLFGLAKREPHVVFVMIKHGENPFAGGIWEDIMLMNK